MLKIGLIADLQYGDIDDFEQHKFYRNALVQARRGVEQFKIAKPDFLVNLGDIIEGGCAETQAQADLSKMLAILNEVGPWHHVVGNHCLSSLSRQHLHSALHLSDVAYYSFCREVTSANGKITYRFIILDSQDISISGTLPGTPERALAEKLLRTLHGPNIVDWNGAMSRAQLDWLDRELSDAKSKSERVIVFNHIPFAPGATSDRHLLWNWSEVLDVLDRYIHVQACFYGHYHKSGYCERNGVHHVTLHGALEAKPDMPCYAVLELHPDRIHLHGIGFDSRVMRVCDAQ